MTDCWLSVTAGEIGSAEAVKRLQIQRKNASQPAYLDPFPKNLELKVAFLTAGCDAIYITVW